MKRFVIFVLCLLLFGCGNITKKPNSDDNVELSSVVEVNSVDDDSTVDMSYDTSVSAEIEKIWATREVKEYGNVIFGVTNVHCHFSIYNYKGRTGSVVIYIEPQFSENLSDGYYTYDSFTSKYDAGEFKDFWVTIKDQDIRYNFGNDGETNYKVRVAICDDENKKLTESNYIGIRLPDIY